MNARPASARASLALASLLLLPLAYSGAALGAVLTVGTDGDYATIQAALDAANLAAGDDEIRVRTGAYTENVALFITADERIELSGGWDAKFSIQTEDPALTMIDAADAGRALDIVITAGTLVVRNLSFTRGAATTGAGVDLFAGGDADVFLADCAIHHSTALDAVSVSSGGGVALTAAETSRVEMARCSVHDNRSESTATVARAGGVVVDATHEAQLVLRELDVFDNEVVSNTSAVGGGVCVRAIHASLVTFIDSSIQGNSIDGGNSETGSGVELVQGGGGGLDTDARIDFRRNRVVGNIGTIVDEIFWSYQVKANANSAGGIVIGDSLIADGIEAAGLNMARFGDATFEIVNITSAGNRNADVYSFGGGSIANSLAGVVDLGLDTAQINSLFDADPGYVDPANGDYRLLLDSPAIGAGRQAPPGGLGPNDLDGKPRRIGLGVDLGAYEADDPVVYIDGFE